MTTSWVLGAQAAVQGNFYLLVLLLLFSALLWVRVRDSRRNSGRPRPFFFNCWNQNVIVSGHDLMGRSWLLVCGKHSPNFPLFGGTYESILLHCMTDGRTLGTIDDQIPALVISRDGDSMAVEFGGKLEEKGTERKIPCRLSFRFRCAALGRQGIFLKRFLPIAHRFVPGAIFRNEWLWGDEAILSIGEETISLRPVNGHLEAGRMSLVSRESWEIPFHYLGVLSPAEGNERRFHSRWKLLAIPGSGVLRPLANWIKGKISKSVIVAVAERHPERLARRRGMECFESIEALATLQTDLPGYLFRRRLVRAKQGEAAWYGIEEDFMPTEPPGTFEQTSDSLFWRG